MTAVMRCFVFVFGLLLGSSAFAQAMYINEFGDVGVGTNDPWTKFHVLDGDFTVQQSKPLTGAILNFVTANSAWEIKQNGVTGRLTFFSPGGGALTASFKFDPQATENLFRVGVLGPSTVDINGNLVINGFDVTPDYVFAEDYQLETIEEHAAFMWQNKHLPALPGAVKNEQDGVNIVSHQFGVLEELEKAHIYIEQLHSRISQLEAQQAQLEQLTTEYEELRQLVMSLNRKLGDEVFLTSLE